MDSNAARPSGAPDAGSFLALLQTIAYATSAEAPEILRDEVRRRAEALRPFVSGAPDAVAIEEQLDEIDVDRVIYLIGTARPALHLIAAAIVELGVTTATIEDVVRWMDVRPIALMPTHAHLGVDIAYIVSFQALTTAQRWMLHSLSAWAPAPATISREHALTVARRSGVLAGARVQESDLDRLSSLAFLDPIAPGSDADASLAGRLIMHPYIRYIAGSVLDSWPMPSRSGKADAVPLTADDALTAALVEWAVHFAVVVAGPALSPVDEMEDEADEEGSEDQGEPHLTPDPALDALTDAEAWATLRPELPHLRMAAALAAALPDPEYIYRLCQVLAPRLRRQRDPMARDWLRELLEAALVRAREASAANETILLATQLADLAVDSGDLERAALFGNEALSAALERKDLRTIGFMTRRLAAIVLRQGDAQRALTLAQQAVAVAVASNDREAVAEGLRLVELARQRRTGDEA
jgi:hypothetical protein